MNSILRILTITGLLLIICCKNNEGRATIVKNNDKKESGICHIWGDPHIWMFPQRPNAPRPMWWCKEEGEHILYQNKWVYFTVTVTKFPFWNEKFNLTFLDEGTTLCSIHTDQQHCNHRKVNVTKLGSTIDIRFEMASLRVNVAHYPATPFYDITLNQEDFYIIGQSSGLCVHGSMNCVLERPAENFNRHRNRNQLAVINPTPEQLFVSEHATEICNKFLESARQSASQLGLPSIGQTIAAATMTSCINDLEFSGDRRFATSTLQLSIIDTVLNMNVTEPQINTLIEQSATLLETAIVDTSTIVEEFIIAENVTLDKTTPAITLATSSTTVPTRTMSTTSVAVVTTLTTTTTPKIRQNKGLCHFYGDPHVLLFPQRTEAFQHQYWCKTPGQHSILLNAFVQIIVIVHDQAWWTDEFKITFFEGNNTVLCVIASDQQVCNSPEIKMTRPSPSQIDVSYPTADLHISIVINQYQSRWYDISVRMPYELISRSSGLCVMPPVNDCELENSIEEKQKLFHRSSMNTLSRQICEEYLVASILAAAQLGVPFDIEMRDNALVAYIHDYEATDNKDFGASIVNMIIKHGINELQLDDGYFELYTNNSIVIIQNAVANATIQIDTLLNLSTTETNTSIILTTNTQLSSIESTTMTMTTTTSVGPESTTKSDCSSSLKLTDMFLHFLPLITVIQTFLSWL